MLIYTIVGCQPSQDPYSTIQFPEIILCQGLDSTRNPIKISEPVSTDDELITLCMYVETDREFFFLVSWYGPGLTIDAVLKANKSGWLVTAVEPSGDTFLPGEYQVRVYILKTKKVTKTFEVIEKDQKIPE